MNKFFNYRLTFLAVLLTTTNIALAESNNFLGGIAHGQLSADLTPNTAGMAAAEVGPRNYRFSGTLGWAMNPNNRFKVTGEWLWQNIDYTFTTGTTRQWVQQSAGGIGYQFVLNNRVLNYLDVSGYYSHAPNKNLVSVDFLDKASGNIYTNLRRIAGSTAGGLNPAAHFNLWQGAEGTLTLNWDDVVYDNRNTSKATAKGFGGTAALSQAIYMYEQNFKLGASAAIRAPFNSYRAEFNWIHPLPTSELLIGFFGDYTKGKQTLPSTSLIGINLSYAMDTPAPRLSSPAPGSAVKPDSLLAWAAVPAVYMPQVLAVADGSFNTCTEGSGPGFSGSIPDQTLADLPLDLSKRFTGNGPLHFSLTKTSGDATVDPSTGMVTATVPSANIVVTATGPCGGPAMTNSFNITV